jgi:hypothetical protein
MNPTESGASPAADGIVPQRAKKTVPQKTKVAESPKRQLDARIFDGLTSRIVEMNISHFRKSCASASKTRIGLAAIGTNRFSRAQRVSMSCLQLPILCRP